MNAHGGKACGPSKETGNCHHMASTCGPIKSVYDNKCMDYYVAHYDRGNVYMHPCHRGANQRWYIVPQRRRYFSIRSHHDRKCLDLDYGRRRRWWSNRRRGTNVYMHNCHWQSNQQWYWSGNQLKSRYNDKCLDYYVARRGNSKTRQYTNAYIHACHTGTNQKWKSEAGNR